MISFVMCGIFRKRCLLASLIAISLLLGTILPAVADGRVGKWKSDRLRRDCINLKDLNLSEEQRKAIRSKQRSYRMKIMELRIGMMEKQLEFRRVLRNPGAGEEDIRSAGKQVNKLIGDFRKVMIDYLVEVRGILSPEHLETWCPPVDRTFRRKRKRRP